MSVKPYYEDESVTIYNADCRDVLPKLGLVDLVLTDPPYNKVNRITHGLRSVDKGSADEASFDLEWAALQIVRLSQSAYVWCGTEQISAWRSIFVSQKLSTRLCFWEKPNPSPMNGEYLWLSSVEACIYAKKSGATFNNFCASPVWRDRQYAETAHPTEKPVRLFKRLILASSNEGGVVLDPFMGSGTTLRAAKDLGRKAIGIEIEERYCEIAAKRMSQLAMDLSAW